MNYLFARFHYFGKLLKVSRLEVEILVDRTRLGYAEVLAHATDMYHVERGHWSYKLHWLVPDKILTNRLLFVYNDASYEKVDTGPTYGKFADMYVEESEKVLVQNAEQGNEGTTGEGNSKDVDKTNLEQAEQRNSDIVDQTNSDDAVLVSVKIAESYSMHK